MRHRAWMLLVGLMIGCGQSGTVTNTNQAATPKTANVPAEVEKLFEQGEVAKAIETLNGLLESKPQEVTLLALRATAHHRLANSEKAIEDLNRAIQIDGKDASLYNNRGFIRLGMGQTVEAGKDFDKAAELSPKYVNAYNNRGLLYLSQRKFEEAIIEFNRALEIDCNYTDAYNNRGFAEFEIGRVGAALDDFNSALRLNKDYVNAYNNRGLLRARVGDFENAVSDFTAAMMIDPLNPKYYEHRRDVYRNQGALDKAQLDDRKIAWLIDYHRLTAAIATSIQPAGKLIQRSQHYLKIDDFDKAIDDLNRAIQLDPLSADALALRANAHLGRKEIEAAQTDAEASLAIKLNDDACSVLGDVYLSKKEYDKAIEYFAKARRIDESVAEAYYAKSKVLAQQGNTDLAKTNLEQALALDPGIEDRLR